MNNYLNHIKNILTLRNFIFLTLVLFISSQPHEGGTITPHKKTGSLKINILSKHIRLMKEKSTGALDFTFTPGTLIRFDDSDFPAADMKIQYAGNRYEVSSGSRILNFGSCIVYSDEREKFFSVKIDGAERDYPLPLEITREKDSLKISVTEKREQYAVDSAYAELGTTDAEHFEAFAALALAIDGRCGIDSLKRKHSGSDFCDLTCCQTYKGRSGLFPVQGPFIDTSGINCGLFFHSSSGGRLFSESVFNSGGRKVKPPADVIYSENLVLSRNLHSSWTAELLSRELPELLLSDQKIKITGIRFNTGSEIVTLITDRGEMNIAPEDFRLRINRRKGWSFIKSNNYSIEKSADSFIFKGAGLGHCTGMSLDGAMQLASMGYSRYEILEHYYPSLDYLYPPDRKFSSQYVIYNINNGEVLYTSTGPSFLKRRIPCGSIFKLFTVIYLAEKRSDLFLNHKFICTGHNPPPLPENCWERKGHGEMNIRSAISLSCNSYFASLYDKIDRDDFREWFSGFTKRIGISMHMPEMTSDRQWAEFLAGLDFREDFSVSDLIRLSISVRSGSPLKMPGESMEIISDSLQKTFVTGTAKITENDMLKIPELKNPPPGIWGKTGTVIAGTNSHCSYGIFTGGAGEMGIITLVRKGKGVDAAHLSVELLIKYRSNR